MNPIVFAMRRPMTVMVGVVAIALGSLLAMQRMAIDIFPNLNLPVIYVCQPYGGMDPAQMEGLLTNYYEYHFLYIGGIHHVESRNIQGMALMKLFFHPGTNMAQAMAETIGYVTRSRAFMPPGTVSPFITRFDAGSVPVGYLVMSSETKTIGEIQDQALFKVRPMFASLPGVSAPPPFGGSQRTVVVRVDPDRLRSYRMSPDEVTEALTTGNTISPSGNVRIGDKMPIVPMDTLVKQADDLGSIPVRLGSPTVYLRDIATIKDASDIPTGYALVNGRRAVYILVTKRAEASTLSVVQNVKEALPKMQAVLPDDIKVSFEFDQSPTVTRAMTNLAVEGALGAILTGLMVFVFLRDWRSVIVVVLNIPFALAGALVALWLTGQTINLMTLGGLALSIGILVDEATVEIENIHHKLETAPSVPLAVRQGNLDTALPRLLAMLCILAVFIPAFFMQGAAGSLFVPLALAVGFAMITSYFLSSTFVPVLSAWLLRRSDSRRPEARRSLFDRTRDAYGRALSGIVLGRWVVVPVYLLVAAGLIYYVGGAIGREIFPRVDIGRFQLRIKAPTGTRIERTEQIAIAALEEIRREVGPEAVEISLGYVGLIPSAYPINAIYQWTGGPEEVVLRVALKAGHHASVETIKARLRDRLAEAMPDVRFSFEPADIVSEVMSFGTPTPIEVAVNGPSLPESRAYAEKVRAELAKVPSLRDLQYVQPFDYPTVTVDLDREKAGISGVTVAEVARSVVAATSSSRFVVPNYWPDPKSGIGYQVQVEVPYTIMDSIGQVETIPVQRSGGDSLLLRDVAKVSAGTAPGAYDRYNMNRVVSLTANIAGEDLGRVAGRVAEALARAGEPPKGATVDVRGQVAPFNEMVRGLSIGLLLTLVVIMLLLTANFQSIRLALVVLSTTPAVLVGVVVALGLTETTINIQSFMGAIMSIGVAVANAILLVTFAERARRAGLDASAAAVEGAQGRLRPILMTSCAMIAGMAPLALGWGEGGEQTAPLGRAVVGGLAAATLATLFVLPNVFALLMGRVGRQSASLDPFDSESPYYYGPEDEAEAGISNGDGAKAAGHHVGAAPIGLVLVAALAWPAAGCSRPLSAEDNRPSAKSATKVEVVKPLRQTLRRAVEEPGQIEPCEVTPIHAKLSGFAEDVGVDIGDRVKKGQVLTELWVPEVEADLKQKQAMVDQAESRKVQAEAAVEVAQAGLASAEAKRTEVQAGVKKAEAELARWQSEYTRTNQLVSERAVTGSVLDEARSKLQAADAARDAVVAAVKSAEATLAEARALLDKARADLVAAEAGVEVAQSEAHRAEVLLRYARIEAPFDGVITRRHVDTGHLTVDGPHGNPLFIVARTDIVTLVVAVPETYAAAVEPGDPVEARIQALGGRTVNGKVSRTAYVLDAATRTLRVEVDIPNDDGTLRPGLYVNARVVAEEHPDVLTVPETALAREAGKASCFVIADGRARRRTVELGLSDGTDTEVVSGLNGDEVVVKVNMGSLVDGQAVAPVEPPPAAKP